VGKGPQTDRFVGRYKASHKTRAGLARGDSALSRSLTHGESSHGQAKGEAAQILVVEELAQAHRHKHTGTARAKAVDGLACVAGF
jgi:hypothetical protein